MTTKNSSYNPTIISLEGNIGSGKSTLVQCVKELNLLNVDYKTIFIQEPVDVWNTIKDIDGITILERYYQDQQKFAFQFQMMAYISRLKQIRDAIKEEYDIIITERSVMTDKEVFAQMLYDEGKISEIEFAIYNKWFDEFISDLPKQQLIYLETSPDTAFKRVNKRGRKGENIPISYLTKCHEYHNKWLKEKQQASIIIDGNNEENNIRNNAIHISEYINSLFKEKYVLMFDGGSRGNPGLCGIGYVIYKNNNIIYEFGEVVSKSNTNNYAEYIGVINGLKRALIMNIKSIHIKGDSKLILSQLNGDYKCKSPNLIPLYNEAIELIKQFTKYSFEHVLREKNTVADGLANKAMDTYDRDAWLS
tara:strand:- start:1885 stop:2973 length:1089 start_codon:yes stop_codon:yes gene_type:complete